MTVPKNLVDLGEVGMQEEVVRLSGEISWIYETEYVNQWFFTRTGRTRTLYACYYSGSTPKEYV